MICKNESHYDLCNVTKVFSKHLSGSHDLQNRILLTSSEGKAGKCIYKESNFGDVSIDRRRETNSDQGPANIRKNPGKSIRLSLRSPLGKSRRRGLRRPSIDQGQPYSRSPKRISNFIFGAKWMNPTKSLLKLNFSLTNLVTRKKMYNKFLMFSYILNYYWSNTFFIYRH